MGNVTDHTDLLERLCNGDRGALARAITLVESRKTTADEGVRRLIDAAIRLSTCRSLRIGITGSPGVGKSTLIDDLGMRFIAAGKRVAVLAIDPSSTHSGGSILGDKTRMARLAAEPDAFIRPSPTSGTLGGVARRTREAIILCEAAGFDRILVETVGVGQSEAEVDQLTDITLLLMIGGAGDSLQGIKRGIMETADIIAITKTDGDDTRRNEVAARDLRNAIALLPARPTGLRPPVLLCSSVTGNGMAELLGTLESAAERARTSGHLDGRRRDQRLQWLEAAITETLVDGFRSDPGVSKEWEAMRNAVATGVLSPGEAADRLVRLFRTAS